MILSKEMRLLFIGFRLMAILNDDMASSRVLPRADDSMIYRRREEHTAAPRSPGLTLPCLSVSRAAYFVCKMLSLAYIFKIITFPGDMTARAFIDFHARSIKA